MTRQLTTKGEVIRATNRCNLQRNIVADCKLKSVVARITTHLKHCHATKIVQLVLSSFFCGLIVIVSCFRGTFNLN